MVARPNLPRIPAVGCVVSFCGGGVVFMWPDIEEVEGRDYEFCAMLGSIWVLVPI